jgi:BirA family biotin operon repressor/biotin-[acetyl-CoA-carboxylase] ligase
MTEPSSGYEETSIGCWTVRRYREVGSTQDVAASLPAWNAVFADSQTAGRGQWKRRFTSDPGGCYLTAVLPFAGGPAQWRGFALAVGWAVVASLRAKSVARMRLRWPNDLMIGDRKVGGILCNQGRPDTLCVGLGLNVTNRPWLEDPGLEPIAGRLADHAPPERLGFPEISRTLLNAIRLAEMTFSRRGLEGLAGTLNECWGQPREVRLELAPGSPGTEVSGRFLGIRPDGDLLLAGADGKASVVRAHQVLRLLELQPVRT